MSSSRRTTLPACWRRCGADRTADHGPLVLTGEWGARLHLRTGPVLGGLLSSGHCARAPGGSSAIKQWRRGVSIGDTLAQARSQAGLTITQVSQRTCIRETIIRGIERDDFSACGGDFYARGHIRSIARAVGIDPEELVHEYDATHGSPQAIRAADVFEPATPIRLKERRSPNWTIAMIIVLAVVLGYGVYRAVAAVGSPAPPRGGGPTAPPPSPPPRPRLAHSLRCRDAYQPQRRHPADRHRGLLGRVHHGERPLPVPGLCGRGERQDLDVPPRGDHAD